MLTHVVENNAFKNAKLNNAFSSENTITWALKDSA
jgi:hypothetical protein